MSAIDDLMRVVDEVISASHQCSTAQRNGATWEEFTDDRKHYAARWCALRDMLQNLLDDRQEAESVLAALRVKQERQAEPASANAGQ